MTCKHLQLNLSTTATLAKKKVTVAERSKQESMYGLSAKKSGRCEAVAIVERSKQESMYGLSAKKSGRCEAVAIVERSKQESMYGLSAKKVAVVKR